MGDYTISLTSDQEKAIVWAKDQHNAASETTLTAKQYLIMIINSWVADYQKQMANVDIPTLKEAYVNANDTVKDQVKTLLGL